MEAPEGDLLGIRICRIRKVSIFRALCLAEPRNSIASCLLPSYKIFLRTGLFPSFSQIGFGRVPRVSPAFTFVCARLTYLRGCYQLLCFVQSLGDCRNRELISELIFNIFLTSFIWEQNCFLFIAVSFASFFTVSKISVVGSSKLQWSFIQLLLIVLASHAGTTIKGIQLETLFSRIAFE